MSIVRYKIKISDVAPRPGNQTTAARCRAADHSFSSTALGYIMSARLVGYTCH